MVHISDLSFAYHPRKPLFSVVSLALACDGGEGVVGLMGPNGAGKSTLLKLIAGVLRPTSGSVRVAGSDRLFDPARREKNFLADMFYMPEEFSLPAITPRKFAHIYGCFYPRFSMSQFDRLLDLFSVEAIYSLKNLSFGARKKMLLAFALACNTQYLLLDEPTSGLDPSSKAAFLSILAESDCSERTTILSTHNVENLDLLFSRVVILGDGRVVLNASYTDIVEKLCFSQDAIKQEAIYSRNTLYGVRSVGLNEHHGESPVDLSLLYEATRIKPEIFTTLFEK